MTVTAKPARSRLDPEPISRRDWLGLASLWTMGAALLFGVVGMLRLPKAAVLSSPSKTGVTPQSRHRDASRIAWSAR